MALIFRKIMSILIFEHQHQERPNKSKTLSHAELELIDKLVKKFNSKMDSGNFHSSGGCSVIVTMEESDCPSG